MLSLIILLVIILVPVIIGVSVYNGLVAKRVAGQNAWSQIEVQLKRRYDLIPNLVETVKGYAAHEKDTLERVIQARNAAVKATGSANLKELSQAENMLTGALRQIFALSENYPDLKANQNFLQLQEEIVSTENRVGFARQHYNDCVASYNTAIQQVPGNFVAGFAQMKPMDFMELPEAEKQAVQSPPKVSF